ncbi:hypothetical protein PWT90_07821 [Aphanocladium album]|nr:hypothetical protein PWT90_07821 [Aphanocladium album]
MELSHEILRQVVLPTAAFYTPPACNADGGAAEPAETCWQDSLLNPKNRVDSLDFPQNPSWRIDGCIAHGTQFYAIPLFLSPTQPHRVDVFIPNQSAVTVPAGLRSVLDLSTAFYTRDTGVTRQLGITRHIVRCLQHWTAHSKEAWQYSRFPFGSRIVFHNIPVNVRDARISIAPTYHLERQMLSTRQLEIVWQDEGVELPPAIDISELHYKAQPHDSVSVVERDGKTLIFKAIASHTKYLYHELRHLLLVPPHPNVIQRPLHLVTKKCGFGSKVAVLGFTLPYHQHGTVRDHIPFLALHSKITHNDEVKWARQLVAALRHLRRTCRTFYSDLRLDNILLSDSFDLIMVDFEQRGVWSEFAAPEINAIECMRQLAMDDELPDATRVKYADLLTQLLPCWESLVEGEEYTWPGGQHGYNVAWQCLDEDEQESCEVYMLGRVLWCLFEAQSAPQRAAIWTSYKSEPTVGFPAYTRTPHEMRRLIDWCTEGRVPTLSSYIVRAGSKLVLRDLEASGTSTPEDVRNKAKSFWTERVAESERWVRKRIENRKMNHRGFGFPNRPSLAVIDTFLEAYANKL